MKKIDVIYTAWIRSIERLAYFVFTVEAMKKFLIAKEYEIKYHLAVEAYTGIRFKDGLVEFCQKHDITIYPKETPPSLSSMLNFANDIGSAPFVMIMQDDFKMVENINIDKCANWLDGHDNDYVIRLLWRDEFKNRTEAVGEGFYWIDPTKRGFLVTDNPAIKKRSFHQTIGPYEDSMEIGEDGKAFDNGRSENSYNSKAKQVAEDCRVLTIKQKAFVHIGRNTTLVQKKFDR